MRQPWMACLGLLAIALLAVGCGSGAIVLPPTPPSVTSVEPSGGAIVGGTPITIRGTGLTNAGVGLNEIQIGGVDALFVVVLSSTEITCVTPPSPTGTVGSFDVTVAKNHGTGMLSSGFTYHPAPVMSAVSPAVGPPAGGQTVTLTGSGFLDNDPGTNRITFASAEATNVNVVNDTTMTCVTPPGTSSAADIVLKNRNGTATLPGAYRYSIPPTVTGVTPPAGPLGGNTLITVSGSLFQQFAGTNTVTIDGNPCTSLVVINDNIMQCRTPASTSGPGPKDVVVTNDNGTATLFDGFTYGTPPSIVSINPTSGLQVGGGTMTITGAAFTSVGAGVTTVRIGPTLATMVSIVNDTTITCQIPAGTPGTVDVRVSNDLGSSTLPLAYTYIGVCTWDSAYGSNAGSGANSDDSQTTVTLGFSFPFFGVNRTSVNIGSNGAAGFGYSVTSFTPSFPSSLSGAVISPCWTDLRPSGGGGSGVVYFKTDASKAVITWDAVFEWPGGPANTFQIQMFSDGRFCILYKVMNSTGTTTPLNVGASPGTSNTLARNLNTLTVFTPLGATQAIYEVFSGGFDLANGVVDFFPAGGGAYNVIYYPLPP